MRASPGSGVVYVFDIVINNVSRSDDYVDGAASPLYPFGHGLGYTTFRISDFRVTPDLATWNGEVTVSVSVTNTGDNDGDEIVQLYVRDPVASVTRRVLELKGFARVGLPAGGSARVTFDLPVGQLGFYNSGLEYVIEPGSIESWSGPRRPIWRWPDRSPWCRIRTADPSSSSSMARRL